MSVMGDPELVVIDISGDIAIMLCVLRLRTICGRNSDRIEEIGGKGRGWSVDDVTAKTTAATAEDLIDLIRVCRVATPSPTPDDDVPMYAGGSAGKVGGVSVQCTAISKRLRCET
jgi:hypothetical protein